MKKSKILLGILSLTLVVVLVAGCGSAEKPAATPPAAQQATGHDAHSAQMPKEDPMPMMKDMDQKLQNLMKQVKAGQTMDAQKTAGEIMSTTDKVMLHMMDNNLKETFRQSAAEIKETVNSGKMDPGTMEIKVKAMQEVMKQTTAHLQTMTHK